MELQEKKKNRTEQKTDMQNKEKALELFDNCGEVEYAPFYLSRASLKKGVSGMPLTPFPIIFDYCASSSWAIFH